MLPKSVTESPLLSILKSKIRLFWQKMSNFLGNPGFLSDRQTKFVKKFTNKGVLKMKKFLALTLLLGASLFTIPSVEAGTVSSNSLNNVSDPQVSISFGNQPRRRWRPRTYLRYRNVRIGYRLYRYTYRVTVYPNGRTRTQLISRVRIR